MVIFFLQKLNPSILPVLHEIINSKKLQTNTSKPRSARPSVNKPSADDTSVEKKPLFYDDDSQNETDDDGEEEVIFHFKKKA